MQPTGRQAGTAGLEVLKALLGQMPVVGLSVDLLDRFEAIQRDGIVDGRLLDLEKRIDAVGSRSDETFQELLSILTQILERARVTASLAAPDLTRLRTAGNGLAVVQRLNRLSATGRELDPMLNCEDLVALMRTESGTPEALWDEVAVVIEELTSGGLVVKRGDMNSRIGVRSVSPSPWFFPRTDAFFQAWSPEQDSRVVAGRIVETGAGHLPQLGADLGWEPRRLNPAVQVLLNLRLVMDLGSTWSEPYIRLQVIGTPATALYARSS